MNESIRKYLSNRGSALFMVISTMSALFLLVTAMYFSVISSKQVQYAVFNQEQSYQSSISISDALVAALRSGKVNDLSNEILKLKAPTGTNTTGDVLSTKGNGFAEFLGEANGTYSDSQLGAYTVDITRLSDATENGTTYQVFDFAITTSVGGALETTHTFVRYTGTYSDPPNIFGTGMTSTGYVPNSPRLDRGTYDTPLRYDAEYTVIGDGSDSSTSTFPQINNDLTCTGTLRIVLGAMQPESDTPLTWVIGNDMDLDTYNNVLKIDLKGTSSQHGRLIIGGDLIASNLTKKNAFVVAANTDVFVMGDMYVSAEEYYGIQASGRLFVKGNIYLTNPTVYNWGSKCLNGWTLSKTNVFVGGSIWNQRDNEDAGLYTVNSNLIKNQVSALDITSTEWTEAFKTWDSKMHSSTYEKWTVISDADTTPHTVLLFNNDYRDIQIQYNKGDVHINTTVPDTTMVNTQLNIADYPNGVVIDDIIDVAEYSREVLGLTEYSSDQKNLFCTVIDTGEDPNAVFRIRVQANKDYDGDGVYETFTWLPIKDAAHKSSTSLVPYVLIKGRGILAIEVPEGVTYQACNQEAFMHINWFTMLGGTIVGQEGKPDFYGDNRVDTVNCSTTALNNGWIHTTDNCKGATKCDITQKIEQVDGENVTVNWCNTHNRKVTSSEISTNGCGCYGVVETSKIDSWIATKYGSISNAFQKAAFKDSSGKTIYPNTNTMIISSDESAQIRLSYFDDGSVVAQNTFWAWIYAPYMTYMAQPVSAGGSGGTRLVGGIIVSDYISNDWYSFVYCRPDDSANEALQQNLESTGTQTGFIWKAYGY